MRLLSRFKNSVVPLGPAPRRVLTGAFAGLMLSLDLQSQTQSWLGLYERELYAPLRCLSRGIRSAIDVGCADGEFTIYFLQRTNSTLVFAIDGNAGYLEHLRRNVALNQCDSRRLVINQEYLQSLDQLAGEIEPPCLVKIDIDGGERDILSNSPQLLALSGVRWIIEVHSAELECDCLRILRLNGYTARVIKNAWWRRITGEQRPLGLNRWIVAERGVSVSL